MAGRIFRVCRHAAPRTAKRFSRRPRGVRADHHERRQPARNPKMVSRIDTGKFAPPFSHESRTRRRRAVLRRPALRPPRELKPFQIGAVKFFGHNPCQRCVVPTRDPTAARPSRIFKRNSWNCAKSFCPNGRTRSASIIFTGSRSTLPFRRAKRESHCGRRRG